MEKYKEGEPDLLQKSSVRFELATLLMAERSSWPAHRSV